MRAPLLVAFGALSLAGCASQSDVATRLAASGPGAYDPRLGVRASEKVIPDDQPVPHGGGYNLVGKPYVIAGRTYYPSEKPFHGVGVGSWYGLAFRGRKTANGEIFDTASLSAAHPTMPLPSYARVTNLANGRSVIVRVNDRGPYHDNRIMDVSEKTAEVLDYRHNGISKIKVEYVGRASLAGSDDDMLLATLRTDGRKAVLDRRADQGPVDDARTEPSPPPPPRPEPRVALADDGPRRKRQPVSRVSQHDRRTIAELAVAPLPGHAKTPAAKGKALALASSKKARSDDDEDDVKPARKRKPHVVE